MDLRDQGMPADQVDAVIADYRTAGLDPALTALLDWCVKLTKTPGAMQESDLQSLRDVGWTDDELLNAAGVCAYFNFINRLADGLGVDLEPEMLGVPPLGSCPW